MNMLIFDRNVDLINDYKLLKDDNDLMKSFHNGINVDSFLYKCYNE